MAVIKFPAKFSKIWQYFVVMPFQSLIGVRKMAAVKFLFTVAKFPYQLS